MKAALYFLGLCFLVWAAVIYWVVGLMLGAVDDMKLIIAKAPVVIEKAEALITDIKTATTEFGAQIDRAKVSLPEITVPNASIVKKYGAAGIDAVKSLALDHEKPTPAEGPTAP
ncbi:hypothetical protein HFO56_00145 [Rhizobium laguerreae]|uniref:hypothetical protein n=1 Tax=Rhizobium laguerreae TaxID=1076926 RepID=UPI001C91BE26|nr:hypothetical protein [Rhizobium laguerreae]MBY3150838.1 hypothetical protein [Rhizobium laguerreae]